MALEPIENANTVGIKVERFAEAQAYLGDVTQAVTNLMSSPPVLYEYVPLDIPGIQVPLFGLDGPIPSYPSAVAPEVESAALKAVPGLLAGTQAVFDSAEMPPPNVAPPSLAIPDVPVITWPTIPNDPPSPSAVSVPSFPAVDLPPVPTFQQITIPSPPDYAVLAFTDLAPEMNLDPPGALFTYNELEHNPVIRGAAEERLVGLIRDGGAVFSDDAERAAFDKDAEVRSFKEHAAYDDVLRAFSSRGFSSPPGAVGGMLIDLRHASVMEKTTINSDIAAKQMKRAWESVHTVLSIAIDHEKMVTDYLNGVSQRAFESAKASAAVAISVYNQTLEAYNALVEQYAVRASVFAQRIKAEAAKAELYRARVDAVGVAVDVMEADVEVYKAQVSYVMALIEAYTAELTGVKTVLEADQLQIETFRSRVSAYSAQVNAATARYNAYQAQVAGEGVKADLYLGQTKAYEATCSAAKKSADLSLEQFRVVTDRAELISRSLSTIASVSAKNAELVSATADASAASINVANSTLRGQIALRSASNDVGREMSMATARANASSMEASAQIASIASQANAQISEAMADATNAQIIAAAQLSAAKSSTVSYSESMGEHTSQSRNDGERDTTSDNSSSSSTRGDHQNVVHTYDISS